MEVSTPDSLPLINLVAVEFLMNHGFRMDGPFLHGVSYLSRVEEKLAREMEEAREKKTHLTDIILGEEDHEAIAFLRRVRQEITDWKDGKSVGSKVFTTTFWLIFPGISS